METPPLLSKKSNVSSCSSSKTSLTPCRRMGLSRRSSLIKQIHQMNNVKTTPVQNECSLEKHDSDSSSLPAETVALTKTPNIVDRNTKVNTLKFRRCLNTPVKQTPLILDEKQLENCSNFKSQEASELQNREESHTHKKRRLSNETKCNSKVVDKSGTQDLETPKHEPFNDTKNTAEPVTMEMIRQVLMSIKEKRKKLDLLKVQETYAKKHNVEELKAQTAKWKTAGQEALRYSVELARNAGYSVTLKQLMEQHGFSTQLIGYNSDDDEFE